MQPPARVHEQIHELMPLAVTAMCAAGIQVQGRSAQERRRRGGGDGHLGGHVAEDAVDVCARFVDLVDGDDDGHAGGPGVRDGLQRLRPHAIVRGDDDDGDVSDLCAPCPHR